ncbi:MlaC/ttg2D family ABC transporter substrate-binding protein [Candidatus Pelagibacter bacterium nBUS_36]|uniref:MlaC/ttg2D family ABC transporter substrate-binding protein n=1 Tax=Candidatus Pelagibacter bacterium nBUS_36 TaxID=3374194 RepID=UPI003EBF847B
MKKYLSLFIFSIIFILNTNHAFSISPETFIKSTVNKAAKTLSSNISKEERIEKLKEIAKETVDITGLGLYSLGANRKGLSKEKLTNYQIVFKEYFLKSFSSRLAEYSNPEIVVNSQKRINENYTIVSSTLIATDTKPEVKIEWRVYTKNPENLLIRDLIIEGLSLARTQKEEFSSIINSNDGQIDALIKNLSEFDN